MQYLLLIVFAEYFAKTLHRIFQCFDQLPSDIFEKYNDYIQNWHVYDNRVAFKAMLEEHVIRAKTGVWPLSVPYSSFPSFPIPFTSLFLHVDCSYFKRSLVLFSSFKAAYIFVFYIPFWWLKRLIYYKFCWAVTLRATLILTGETRP